MAKWIGIGMVVVAGIMAIPLIVVALALASMGGGGEKSSNTPDSSSDFSGECAAKGKPAYGLPASNIADREKVFGKANSEDAKQPVSFMGNKFQAHKKVVPCLEAVEKDLKAQGEDKYKIRLIGAYNPRPGEPLYFFHMYGAAIDINWDTNPFCNCETHDIPEAWVKTFEKYGFFWGGNYRTKKDWMHFEWHGEAP